MKEFGVLDCLVIPGPSKDIQYYVRLYSSSIHANHQIKHQATRNVGCQSGDCRWPLYHLQGFVWVCTCMS